MYVCNHTYIKLTFTSTLSFCNYNKRIINNINSCYSSYSYGLLFNWWGNGRAFAATMQIAIITHFSIWKLLNLDSLRHGNFFDRSLVTWLFDCSLVTLSTCCLSVWTFSLYIQYSGMKKPACYLYKMATDDQAVKLIEN